MRTPLCDEFGIEYPIFAFTHCRDVVAAVSKAGGFGVLGAVGFSPEQLEIELDWIDEHVDGKPYGLDTVMPQKFAADVHGSEDELRDQIRAMIPDAHWRYVDELMARFDLPELPEGEGFGGVVGWAEDVARRHVEIGLAHPIKLIAERAGLAAQGRHRPRARARHQGRGARGQGGARAAPHQQRCRHRRRPGLRGRWAHR